MTTPARSERRPSNEGLEAIESHKRGGEQAPINTDVLLAMQRWLDRAVIGLNLCPFAKAMQTKGQIRWVASDASTPEALAEHLLAELQRLAAAPAQVTDTTLLVHPSVLRDFAAFNDFLDVVDTLLFELNLEGVLQVAPLHPQFRFAGSRASDLANHTNRSPHPCLHLLREASVSRAVEAFPQAEAIFEKNTVTLRELGSVGYRRLLDMD